MVFPWERSGGKGSQGVKIGKGGGGEEGGTAGGAGAGAKGEQVEEQQKRLYNQITEQA